MWLKTRSYNILQKCSNPISAKSRQDVNYMYLNETEKQRPVYPQLQTFQTNAHGAHECCRVYRTTVSPNTLLQQVVLLLRNFFSGGHWLTGRQEILHRYHYRVLTHLRQYLLQFYFGQTYSPSPLYSCCQWLMEAPPPLYSYPRRLMASCLCSFL